jgi:hypothetical protein
MIIFDLKCGQGHVFEGWFGSSADYDDQQARGLVTCPMCGAAEVSKAPMAPAVPAKADASPGVKEMLAAAAAVQKRLLEGSDAVGARFADEARAIHHGEAANRPIHGRATRAEAVSLVEEGVPIAALPFPVIDPADEN